VAASSQGVSEGAKSAAAAGEMAANVERAVLAAAQAVQSISAQLAESSAATREIAISMEKIKESAVHNAAVAQGSMREAKKVDTLAEKLKVLAAQFHV